MGEVIPKAVRLFDNMMKQADPRVEDLPMMSTPWLSLVICVLYVYMVCSGLPRFMEGRKPFDLRNVMVFYNFAMVAFSGYIFMEFALSGWFAGYSFGCQPVDYSKTTQALRMVNACWWFYFSKFIELLDTVFFILRKKNSQVTFLHVFHHSIMPVSWWFGVKFVPGGFGTFHALLNSFIHFMMYIYYGLAAFGPRFQRFLWWKKYMTSMQITQFLLVCLHSSQLLFIDCNYPVVFTYWILSYAVIFLIMFADFYIKAYKKPKTATNGKIADGKNNNGVMTNGKTANGSTGNGAVISDDIKKMGTKIE